MSKQALQGIRVLDLSHVLAAPFTTMFLADLGAEVIHVEPPQGDDSRAYGPFIGKIDLNHSAYYISINRNKKSVVLDLKHEKARELLNQLIMVSDIFVENYRPGTMKSLGFGWEDVHKLNSRLIYASISGFGHKTLPEYECRPAYDLVAQAYSGLMSNTGPEDGNPCKVGSSIGDIMSGHQAAIGILAALYYRTVTGEGQHYDGSMVDGLFASLENATQRYLVTGEIPRPTGTAHANITPFEAVQTKDDWIIIPIGNDKLWAMFCKVIEFPGLIQDPKFKTNPLRTINRTELMPLIKEKIRTKSTAEWSSIFDAAGLPYSPINNTKNICEDPHILYREMLVEVEQPGIGMMKMTGSPIRLSETPGKVTSGAPLLGQHTEEVLSTLLGLSPVEIYRLKDSGAIRTADNYC